MAVQTSEKTIDNALLLSLIEQGFDARARRPILGSRRFEDDIRVCAGDDELSIEIENYGNRLEFDILKMMSFAETVPENYRAWGCLVVPVNKKLGNPFISGSGQERIWDYLTKRLLPMTLPIRGLRISNILVLGYERAAPAREERARVSTNTSFNGEKLRGLIQRAWINAGKPSWDVGRTVREAIDADVRLEQESNNPAPRFRANRRQNNFQYLRRWVIGCKFDWLRGN